VLSHCCSYICFASSSQVTTSDWLGRSSLEITYNVLNGTLYLGIFLIDTVAPLPFITSALQLCKAIFFECHLVIVCIYSQAWSKCGLGCVTGRVQSWSCTQGENLCHIL